MPRYCIFDAAGIWTGRVVVCSETDVALNLAPGELARDDVVAPERSCIVDGQVADYRPPAPDADHEWNDAAGQWRLKASIAAQRARRAEAQDGIEALERQQARAMREHAIGRGGTPAQLKKRLEDIDDQITALRGEL